MLDELISALLGALDIGNERKRRRAQQREASGWGPPPKSRAARITIAVLWGMASVLLAVYLERKFGWK